MPAETIPLPSPEPGSAPFVATPPDRSVPLTSGWAAFDEIAPVAPGRVTLLDVASHAALDLFFGLLASAIHQDREAVLVDGANALDVYRFARAAKRFGLSAGDALDGVRVARAFTAHQLQTLVEDTLPANCNAATGVIAVAGLPDLYLDEDLAPAESRTLATRSLATLHRLARETGLPVLVTNETVPPRARHALRYVLEEGVDEIVGLYAAPLGGLRVHLPRRGIAAVGAAGEDQAASAGRGVTVLAPAPRARLATLDAFADEASRPALPRGFAPIRSPSPMRYVSDRAGEVKVARRERDETFGVKRPELERRNVRWFPGMKA